MKQIYSKFPYLQPRESKNISIRSPVLSSKERNLKFFPGPITNNDYSNSNKSSFLMMAHNQLSRGDEESKVLSPTNFLSPRSNASSFGHQQSRQISTHKSPNRQPVGQMLSNRHRNSVNSSLSGNTFAQRQRYLNAVIKNSMFKRRYNEVIGNVISERQRKTSIGTPAQNKSTKSSSITKNSGS